jgi:hypothetical protein
MAPRTASLLVLLPTLFLASMARADIRFPEGMTFLSLGPLFSVTGQSGETKVGFGVEATFNAVVIDELGGLGAFAQAQVLGSNSFRLSGGAQATFAFLGAELGLMHQGATDSHTATTGLHIVPYLAFLYGSVGLRIGVPLTGSGEPGRPRPGTEVGLVLTAKFPFEVDGTDGLTRMF